MKNNYIRYNDILRIISGLIACLVISATSCTKEDAPDEETPAESNHPVLLLVRGEELQIRSLIDADETWRKIHLAILEECQKIKGQPPVKRELTGRRLLSKSREALKRIFYLSYAYRMTGDESLLQRAEREMMTAAGFTDWNPDHFLDVAEMTMGMAIGYDWLYEELPEDSRKTIREAIVNKGLSPSFDNQNNWFLRAEHNWNQVCNAGMTYGALAVQEHYPDMAERIIDRAFETIELPMGAYGPDGTYPEGYGYWGYGTSFNVMFLSAIEKALGTDKGLAEIDGFLNTGEFLLHMLAPSGDCFNWSDNNAKGSLNPAMFWFAFRNNDPSLLWSEKQFLEVSDFSRLTNNRLLPAILIWGKDLPLENIQPPDEMVWVGQGASPVALMRTSWTDWDAIYLGFKAGSPSVNHAHMDIGSFVMEADGVRWAADLGVQNYNSLESKGIKVFGKEQDAQRWTIFRMNNYAHNVLTINSELQRVKGYGKINRFSDDENFMYAISDISSVYKGQLKKAVRGVGIKDASYVIIRDELESLDQSTVVRWNMVTPAKVEVQQDGATLTQDGKKLYLRVSGPDNIRMKTWSTASTNDYDAPNPGTIMVGFEFEMSVDSRETIEVILIPERAHNTANFSDKDLVDW